MWALSLLLSSLIAEIWIYTHHQSLIACHVSFGGTWSTLQVFVESIFFLKQLSCFSSSKGISEFDVWVWRCLMPQQHLNSLTFEFLSHFTESPIPNIKLWFQKISQRKVTRWVGIKVIWLTLHVYFTSAPSHRLVIRWTDGWDLEFNVTFAHAPTW